MSLSLKSKDGKTIPAPIELKEMSVLIKEILQGKRSRPLFRRLRLGGNSTQVRG